MKVFPRDYKRALEMYLQGCVGFEMYQATNAQDQGLLDEVHVQVRKNAAAAAIKTRDWTICIESCTKVLAVESADIKSYYRRACAQWHLGEVEQPLGDEGRHQSEEDALLGRRAARPVEHTQRTESAVCSERERTGVGGERSM